MRVRFQADADLNHKVVTGLRRREPALDFQSALNGGVFGKSDPEVLAIAARERRVLVSHDRQTMPAHFARFVLTQPSPGLIIIAQHLDIGLAIEELLMIWSVSDASEWENAVLFLPL